MLLLARRRAGGGHRLSPWIDLRIFKCSYRVPAAKGATLPARNPTEKRQTDNRTEKHACSTEEGQSAAPSYKRHAVATSGGEQSVIASQTELRLPERG